MTEVPAAPAATTAPNLPAAALAPTTVAGEQAAPTLAPTGQAAYPSPAQTTSPQAAQGSTPNGAPADVIWNAEDLRRGKDPLADGWLQTVPWHQIYGTAQQVGELAPHPAQHHQAHMRAGLEVDQQVHVAVSTEITAQRGPEEG